MRAVCFVKRIQWDLPGTIFRHGITFGDVDNDGDNELIVGTAEGDLFIFKGTELWHKISGLGLITSITIGDIFNYGRNALIVICGDGWVYIYYCPRPVDPNIQSNENENSKKDIILEQGKILESSLPKSNKNEENTGKIECIHVQRIPTNTKVVLLADVDKDGFNELIIGLTDRVVRSYRWSSNSNLGTGKLIGLNKWECANQIGTVTLQDDYDGTPTLLVSQPGGTFMRIKCHSKDTEQNFERDCSEIDTETSSSVDYQTLGISRMRNPNISTEILGNLEPKIIKFTENINKSTLQDDKLKEEQIKSSVLTASIQLPPDVDTVDGNLLGGNVVLGDIDDDNDKINKNYLTKNMMKEHNLKLFNKIKNKEEEKEYSKIKGNTKSYALATLDGTIMLVKDEIILWAMMVDHHLSALCRLDVTGDGADEIIACAWDGQTYILDQQRNSVRFQFEEPVKGFCAGMYSVTPKKNSPCFLYNNFNNKIFLYYDVNLPSMVVSALNPEESLEDNDKIELENIIGNQDVKLLTEWLLYN